MSNPALAAGGMPPAVRPYLLKGFTALDLTDIKGQLCGRFLSDLGMEVIKLEPPQGDPARRLGPVRQVRGERESLRFAHLNAGKKSVVLDIHDAHNRESLIELVGKVDVVIESFDPGYLDSIGMGYRTLAGLYPRLVMASITGFGQTGPRRNFAYNDLVIYAMSGLLNIGGDPAKAPCRPPETQAYYFGSLMAALGIVAALNRRATSNAGDWVDVSMQEALACQEHTIRSFAMDGKLQKRAGSKHAHVAPGKVFPCRDGYVYLYMNRNHWVRFLDLWDGHPEALDDPALLAEPVRWMKGDFIHACLEQYTLRFGKHELTELMQRNRIPCAPVNQPEEWLKDEQLRSRGFMVPARPEADPGLQPVSPPYLLDGCRPTVDPTPKLGEHQDWLKKHVGDTAVPPPKRADGGAFRVLSFDQILAGPYGTTLLAELGADIIKVESRRGGLDMFRFFGKTQDPNVSPRFLEFNRSKRSLTVNLKSPEGPRLIRQLSTHCDAVLDNYSVHVMPSLGLDHEGLSKAKPEVITVRMPGLGCTGPKSEYATVGTIINAITGFTYLWNHEDGLNPPVGTATVMPDYVSGLIAAILIISARLHKARTGKGVFIDISQAEAASYMIGTSLMQAFYSDEALKPIGNGSPDVAPHGCYPARGDDRWCVIAAETEEQWQALAREIGVAAPGAIDLVRDPRFITVEGRIANRAELDRIVGQWTRNQDAHDLMERLQAVGMPSGVVQTGADLVSDTQLLARGFIVKKEHPRLGKVTLPGFPIRFANSPVEPGWEFPLLGRDNHAICADLLGFDAEEIRRLEQEQVLD